MLLKLSEQIAECYRRAEECAQRADRERDPNLRDFWSTRERHWISLARSYELSERIERFPPTKAKLLLRELSGQEDVALRLQEISTLLIQEGNLDALYEHVLDAAIGLMSADMGSMQKYDPDRDQLQLLTSRGFRPESVALWDRVNRHSATSCGMALSAGRRVVVPDIESSDFMAGSADLNASRRSGIRAMHSTPLVSRSGRLLGMISTHWQKPHHPAEHEFRAFDVLARQAADLIERTQVEAALRESEQQLRWLASIVVSSHDAIISKDISGTITTWNHAAELLFGYTSEEVIGRPVTILIPPDRHSEELLILERISRGERIENYETVRRRKDGSSVDVSLTISPVRNAEGSIVGASKIARDITSRKLAEAREKMLTAELDHRVKNVLAQVDGIVASTGNGSGSKNDFIRSLRGRLQSMSAAHSLLSKTSWRGVGLDCLVHTELAPYVTETNVKISGTDIILDADQAQALAKVLHELATNAAKYGALSTPSGQVSVSCGREPSGGSAILILEWREHGGPPVASEVQSSYGTDLIRNLIPHELGGRVDLVFAKEGLNCRIEFPFKQA